MRYFNLIKNGINKILDKTIGVFEMAVLGIIVVSTLSYALAWQAPGQTPPAGNVGVPINVGPDAQVKGGNLVVNALGITASSNALLVPNGNVGIGTTEPKGKLSILGQSSENLFTIEAQKTETRPSYHPWYFRIEESTGGLALGYDKERIVSLKGGETFKQMQPIDLLMLNDGSDRVEMSTAYINRLLVSEITFYDNSTQKSAAGISCNWDGGRTISLTNPGGECCIHTITCDNGRVTSINL